MYQKIDICDNRVVGGRTIVLILLLRIHNSIHLRLLPNKVWKRVNDGSVFQPEGRDYQDSYLKQIPRKLVYIVG